MCFLELPAEIGLLFLNFIHSGSNGIAPRNWVFIANWKTLVTDSGKRHSQWLKSQHLIICRKSQKPISNTANWSRCPRLCIPSNRAWWPTYPRNHSEFVIYCYATPIPLFSLNHSDPWGWMKSICCHSKTMPGVFLNLQIQLVGFQGSHYHSIWYFSISCCAGRCCHPIRLVCFRRDKCVSISLIYRKCSLVERWSRYFANIIFYNICNLSKMWTSSLSIWLSCNRNLLAFTSSPLSLLSNSLIVSEFNSILIGKLS